MYAQFILIEPNLCLSDDHSRDQAIVYYKKAFELNPTPYSGINVATLMVVRGESFATSAELNQIALVLNSLLGRKAH